jgi:hypothetical protein
MAYGKAASGLILAGVLWASAAEFPVRHEHFRGACPGVMTANEDGIRFAGQKGHAWFWRYEEIQQLRFEPGKIRILSYKDSKLRLGADREFEFTGQLPVEELFGLWTARMDQRFVAALPAREAEGFSILVKHLGRIGGSQGVLSFGSEDVVFDTTSTGDSRHWRYSDIAGVSSSGPFQLTVTTFEQARSHYGDRKEFNFQLKQPIAETKYNQLWMDIERKSGRIQ